MKSIFGWGLGVILMFCVPFTTGKLLNLEARAEGPTKTPQVVVSIKPLHSLVAGVMEGVGKPQLLLPGHASPHHFQMKPSDASRLERADLIVWVGPLLETPFKKILKSLGKTSASMEVLKLPSLVLLESRGGHDHDDHKHKAKETHDHDEHKHGAKGKHKHDEHKHEVKGKHEHDDHKHGAKGKHEHDAHDSRAENIDPHIWLNLKNAIVITNATADKLAKLFPKHRDRLLANAKMQVEKLTALSDQLLDQLSPLKGQSYMVFHDAYQYFTKPYGLRFGGALSYSKLSQPSAKHLRALRSSLLKEPIRCVFSEPQFSDKMITALIKGTGVKSAQLDPIGVNIPPGSNAYIKMMQDLGDTFSSCMKSGS